MNTREAFEEEFAKYFLSMEMERKRDGYASHEVNLLWEGYQAATKRTAKKAVEICEEVLDANLPMEAIVCAQAITAEFLVEKKEKE